MDNLTVSLSVLSLQNGSQLEIFNFVKFTSTPYPLYTSGSDGLETQEGTEKSHTRQGLNWTLQRFTTYVSVFVFSRDVCRTKIRELSI